MQKSTSTIPIGFVGNVQKSWMIYKYYAKNVSHGSMYIALRNIKKDPLSHVKSIDNAETESYYRL